MPAKTIPLLNDDDIQVFQEELRALDMGYYILFEVAINVPFLVPELLSLKVKSIMRDEKEVSNTLYVRKKYIRLEPELHSEIKSYLRQREILWGKSASQDYLFCNLKKNSVIVGSSFTKAIYRIRKKYGMESIYGLTSMRKAYAVRLLTVLPIEEVARIYDKDTTTFKDYISY